MLLTNKVLDEIITGRTTLLFRRWKRPAVRIGGTQMTQKGIIGIDSVGIVTEKQITEKDARAAGFASKKDLMAHLFDRDEPIYRIGVHFVGEDPRKTLRAKTKISGNEMDELLMKLARLDAASKHGKWTQTYLQMIKDQPNIHASILAASVGLETLKFKPMVRKLKELGLTESLRPGYRLSPRGEKVLATMKGQ